MGPRGLSGPLAPGGGRPPMATTTATDHANFSVIPPTFCALTELISALPATSPTMQPTPAVMITAFASASTIMFPDGVQILGRRLTSDDPYASEPPRHSGTAARGHSRTRPRVRSGAPRSAVDPHECRWRRLWLRSRTGAHVGAARTRRMHRQSDPLARAIRFSSRQRRQERDSAGPCGAKRRRPSCRA